MQFSNLKVGARLGIGFGTLCLFLVVTMTAGVVNLGRVNEGTNLIAHNRLPKIVMATALQAEINDIAVALRNMMLNENAADRQKQLDAILQSRNKAKSYLDTLHNALHIPKAAQLVTEMQAVDEKYVAGQELLIKKIQSGALDEAKAYLVSDLRPVLANYKGLIAEQIKLQTEVADQVATDADKTYADTRNLMMAMAVIMLGCAAWIAFAITRSITRPVNQALLVANTVASGDLTSRIDITSKDELGMLLQALKRMNENLTSTIGTVRSGTEMIASASSQVAAGNQDLSSRTEQQASALEETASSMEELTATVRQNADNARQANGLAHAASAVAVKGGDVITQVVDTMDEINGSAAKIGDIISVIDSIAFQTNILALNAAVEAARAGEQGRGFAVVASEVRNLAQRSAGAAKEIKALIEDSTARTRTGSKLVHDAGDTMVEIVESVKRVTDIMAEITAASDEQSAGIEQINQAVTQMDEVTQQNAALVEEAAAASEAMQEQAAKLAAAVAVFQISGASAAPAGALLRTASAPRRAATVKAPARRSANARIASQPASNHRPVRSVGAAVALPSGAQGGDWEAF